MAGLIVNLSEAAAILGKSQPTIKAWAAKGMPVISHGKKLTEWQINICAVIDWLQERAVANAVGDTKGLDIEEARRRKLAAEAAKAEIELALMRGDAISIDAASEAWLDVMAAFRARILAIPPKIVPELLNEDDLVRATDLLRGALFEALDELAGGTEIRTRQKRRGEADGGDPGGAIDREAAADADC